MSQQPHSFFEPSSEQQADDLRRNIVVYLRRWPIFVLSALVFLFLTWLILRYTTPIYQTETKVLIKNSKQSMGQEMLLNDLMMGGGMNSNSVDNEIQLMKSERLLLQVVEDLDLQYAYSSKGRVIDVGQYKNNMPLHLICTPKKDIELPFVDFEVYYKHPKIEVITASGDVFDVKINQKFEFDGNEFQFVKNPLHTKSEALYFNVSTRPIRLTAKQLQGDINVELIDKYTTVLRINYQSPIPAQAEAILNHLVDVYNKDAIRDKNLEFEKTEEFIEDRLNIISNELEGVEADKESFKEGNKIAILEAEAAQSIGNRTHLENELLAAETQLSLVGAYKSHVQSQDINEILPSDISDASGASNQSISAYNTMVTERNNLLATGATDKHPVVQNLTNNIKTTKNAIVSNINKKISALSKTRSNFAAQLGETEAFKSKVPHLERVSRDINRQQQVKESLYLLLLQKREEAAISKAITSDKAKVIDPPFTYPLPVKPKKSLFYLGGLVLGLLLPFGVIYTQEFFKNKIESRDDLEALIDGAPIVAELPSIENSDDTTLVGSDLSSLSEAFRIMRTNVEFVISKRIQDKGIGKVILVTSSIKGEGKTLVSMNYAHILGQLKNKRTIIVGADIRNPQLHRFHGKSKNIAGLTEYLYDEDTLLDSIIHSSSSNHQTDIIYSGKIPPNPSELLMSAKFDKLIDELKHDYDYVIIDSAPVVLVSDTYHISNTADLTVYVTRSEHTPKDVIQVPMDAIESGRLNNVVFVLNDISASHSGYAYGYKYNYGYGYGYGSENRKRSILHKFLSGLGIKIK